MGNIIVVLIVVHMLTGQTQAADALLIHKHNAAIHTGTLQSVLHTAQLHAVQLIAMLFVVQQDL